MSTDERQALEARLQELYREEQAEAQRRRESVKPVYEFLLTAEEERATFFGGDRLYDDTCRFYKLSGRVTNKEALEEVGAARHLFEGAMRYVFNGATGRFVCAVGGGSVFVSAKEAWDDLSLFVAHHPEGGDVSNIVSHYRNRKDK